jgi:type I restriction-modification system DNA methylase subunit
MLDLTHFPMAPKNRSVPISAKPDLNIPRYVDTFVEEEPIDVDAVQAEIEALEAKLVVVRAEMAKKLAEIQR